MVVGKQHETEYFEEIINPPLGISSPQNASKPQIFWNTPADRNIISKLT